MEPKGVHKIPTAVTSQFVKASIEKKSWQGPVIDLGAGGQAHWYKPHFHGQIYVQLDVAPEPSGSTDIVADILNMPQVKSDFYGVVLLLETLEHVSNPFQAFKEAARILRPGGLFICTTVACWWLHRHPKDYWRFLPDGLTELCRVTGLEIYHEVFNSINALTPAHCCVAAVKE